MGTTTSKTQSRLAAIEANSIDPVIAVSAHGNIVGWNPAAEKLYGYAAREIKGRPMSVLFARNHLGEWKRILTQLRRGGSVRQFETVGSRKDMKPVTVSLSISPIRGHDGSVTEAIAIVRDITRRIRGRETILQRNRELLTFHRVSQIVLSSGSLQESYREIVREICAATGFPIAAIAILDDARQTLVFHGLQRKRGRADSPVLEFPVDQTVSGIVLRTGKPLIESHISEHPVYRSKVLRRTRAQTFFGFPMKVGRKIIGCLNLAHTESVGISAETAQWIEGLANYVAVLTERKRAEEELRSSREQLRELSRRTRSAIEDERKRIAREIHDELGQELSLLQLDVGLLRERLPRAEKDLRKKTESMTRLIDSAIRSVQRISSTLRPTLLDNVGLGAAAEWAVAEFQRRSRIRCRTSIAPPDLVLDPERSTALFRILQEALTNVLRHAKATRVDVTLVQQKRHVTLRIRDNGTGISPSRIQDPKSAGLVGMRERVLPWEGTVAITGRPRKGTEVVVTVPAES